VARKTAAQVAEADRLCSVPGVGEDPTFVGVSKARWMWAAAAVGWAGTRTSWTVSFKTFRMDLQRSE